MNFYLHLKKGPIHLSGKKVLKIQPGINSANAIFPENLNIENSREPFVLVGHDDSVILCNPGDEVVVNGELIPVGSQRQLEIDDEILSREYLFLLSNSESDVEENKGTDHRTFAEILEDLSQEEDFFALEIRDANDFLNKIPISTDTLNFGWDKEKRHLTTIADEIDLPLFLLQKDWSGITIYPEKRGATLVNGEALKSPRLLSHQDVITFSITELESFKIIFSEPAALLEINSLIRNDLQNSIAPNLETDLAEFRRDFTEINRNSLPTVKHALTKRAKRGKVGRKNEMVIMFVTLILASMAVFGVLELLNR